MKRAIAVAGSVALVGTALVAAAAPASADVEAKGSCSGASSWHASLDFEHRKHDLEFEVKTATPGQRWRLTIRQNGKQVYSQVRRAVRTDDASPRAEVQWDVMRPDDVNARERFVLRATNLATGEVCRTTLREA